MLYVNGLRAVSIRLFQPWLGAWTVEADLDLEAVPVVPSGPVTVKIGDANPPLLGTVDGDASGRFGDTAKARIVGGAGGWHRTVSARHFHNDAGVTTSAVISATAAEIAERVVVAIPKRLGVDFLRTAGPASRVLSGLDWYVDPSGVTIVSARTPTTAAPATVDVLAWDPHEQRADFAADVIVMPGTVLTDPRFGTLTVRDVEQTFTANGARGRAWCASSATATPGGKLVTLLASVVRETGKLPSLRTYRYRVVLQGVDGRLSLQAIDRGAGAPDSLALPPWYGLPGVKAKIVPGTEAAVVFLNGDFAQPAVVSFNGKTTEIAIGDAPVPVALAPNVTAALETLKGVFDGWTPVANDGGAALKALLKTALASWPPTIAATKLKTD